MQGKGRSGDGVWEEVTRQGGAGRYRLNPVRMRERMAGAGREGVRRAAGQEAELSIPLPGGGYGVFRLEESPVMEPGLAVKYPGIRSYRGVATDGSGATMRADISPRGFHAFLLIDGRAVVVHPLTYGGEGELAAADYLSYDYWQGQAGQGAEELACAGSMIPELPEREELQALTSVVRPSSIRTGDTLRTFRLALATTQEFTNASGLGGGTVAGTIAALNTLVNSVNAIYERELAIRFTLVANNDQVVYTAEPDPFSNLDLSSLLNQVRPVLRDRIGVANYDLGMVLGTGGGGVALLGVVCDNSGDAGPNKGAGVSSASSSGPVTTGTANVVHEIGHQFNAMHSFNTSCGGNRNGEEAWESASGLTIMSYAGGCAPDRIVTAPEMRFHGGSLVKIRSFVAGLSCGTSAASGNQVPTVDGGPDYTIPKNTPFVLTASATDGDVADRANLTYAWEQYDAGGTSYANPPYIDTSDPATTTRPIFRPFPVTSSPQRTFPSLTYILNNANDPPFSVNNLQTAEELPRIGRALNFIVTARDNRGGMATDTVALTVSGSTGPFQVTSPNTAVTWTGGTTATVQWSVAGTDGAPINCASVRILLSTDGGSSFPLILAASTPNNGSATVSVPNFVTTTSARVRVEAIGNIFFDISDTNLTITPPTGTPVVTGLSPQVGGAGTSVALTGINFTGVTQVIFSGNAVATFVRNSSTQITATVPSGAVSGPIRLVKSGYSDALSGVFSFCSSAASVLTLDDGSRENAYGNTGITHYVNRLTPASYPATLTGVYLNLNLTAGTAIEVVVGVNADGDASIDGTVFQATTVQAGTRNSSVLYSVPALTIGAGDFVVGFRYTPGGGALPANVDETPPLAGRSYLGTSTSFSQFGAAGSLTEAGNLMIRGQVYEGSCVFCSYAATPATQSVSSLGGAATVSVVAGAGCGWQTVSYNSWITIGSGAFSTGSGEAGYTVAPNTSFTPRSGMIVVAGQYVSVTQGGRCAIDIDQVTLPGGTVGTAYNRTMSSANGKAPLVFAVTSGSLPPGVQLSSGGVFSGAPTAPGTYTFSIGVTDANLCVGVQDYAININCPTIQVEPTLMPTGTIRTPYSQTLTQLGGVGAVTWSSTGTMPPGLSLGATTGILSGTPTAKGTFSLTIYATDGNGCFGGQAYSVTIGCQTLSLSPQSIPGGQVGVAYSQRVTQSDGVGTISWSSTGTLPPGLTLNSSTGYLEGTPTATGTFSFRVKATDGNGCVGERDYQLAISCQSIAVSPQTLSVAVVETAWSQTFLAEGAAGSVTWSLIGTPPTGLTLNPNSGALSGKPTAIGSYSFTIRATDANGCFGQREYTMTVGCQTITVNPTALPSGRVNSVYSETLTQSGATGAVAWSLTGSLPAGLSFSTSSGVISGTPTANGSFSFTVRATDVGGCFGERSFQLVIDCQAITILPATLSAGTVDTAYNQLFTQQGGTGSLTWSVSGTLPPGESLSPTTGALTGTPTTVGNFRFTVRATDANGCFGERTYDVAIGCQAVTVGPGGLPSGKVSNSYNQTLTAIGAIGAATWSITGDLPAGLSFDTTSGQLSGTPTLSGSYAFTARATDTNGCFGERQYTLEITCQTLTIDPPTLPGALSGTAYSQSLTQTGGLGILVWSRTGRLPAGVTLSSTTGLLSGTPSEIGSFNFTIFVSDSAGCFTERSYTLVVTCPTLELGPATLPNASNGVAYTQALTQARGVSTITWSTTGVLPPGMKVDAATGVLSGTSTVTGSYNFTVRATDANGCVGEKSYTLVVACPTIAFAPATLPGGTVNNAYSQTLTPGAGVAPFVWSLTGTLPAGYAFDTTTGTIAGTTTTTGSFNLTIKVTDANGCVGQADYQLTIACPTIAIGPMAAAGATIGAAYSQVFTQSGAGGPVVWSLSGTPPPGLTFDVATATLAGIPTATGDFSFTLRVTEGSGCFAEKTYQLKAGCQSITVGPATLPGATLAAAYAQTLVATGGIGTTVLALSGTLPPGMAFSATTGALSGTPTATGTYRFTVRATDSNGCYGETTWDLVVGCQSITVTPGTVPGGGYNSPYSQTFAQSGGIGSVVWSLIGTPPAGLSFDATTATLAGTPTAPGSFPLVVRATDSNGCYGEKSFTLAIACQSITVTTSSLTVGAVNSAYSMTLAQAGGSGATVWSVTGTLPAGLSLDPASGQLSGTPTVAGSFALTLRVTDVNGCFGERALQLVIACQAITLSPSSLPGGTLGTAYSQSASTSGATGTVVWSVTGTLPAGLTLNASTGAIAGTPTIGGTSTFRLRATDVNGCFGEREYTLTVVCQTISVSPESLPDGTASAPYAETLTQSGGIGGITWVIAGSLPAGLTINPNNGVLSGIPTTTGTFNFTARAIDANGCYGERSFQLVIACPTLSLSPATLPDGVSGDAYSQQLSPGGGVTPITWSSTGVLPTGLTLNPSTGLLAGTPTANGSYSFNLRATDANSCFTERSYQITITCPTITISPASLSYAPVDVAFSLSFTRSGGVAPITWSSSGSLPPGLSLNTSTGALTGTPTVIGTYTFNVRATDANLCFAERGYTLLITDGSVPIFEADVAPRPNGDSKLTVVDWVQIGRFTVGLDSIGGGTEFQRVDTAPRSTFGNGTIDVSDWVQAGRYVVGLDPVSLSAGPAMPNTATPQIELRNPASRRIGKVRPVASPLVDGLISTIDLRLEASGGENALAFTLRFDPRAVTFVEAISDNATIVLNRLREREGMVAVALALPPGTSLASGIHRLLSLRLMPLSGATSIEIDFDDSLVPRQLVSADGTHLTVPLFDSYSDRTRQYHHHLNPPLASDLHRRDGAAGGLSGLSVYRPTEAGSPENLPLTVSGAAGQPIDFCVSTLRQPPTSAAKLPSSRYSGASAGPVALRPSILRYPAG